MYGEAWLLSLLEDRMFALLGPCRVLRAVKPPVFFPHLSKHPCMWRHSASPSFLGARFWERKAGVKAGSYCRKGKTLEKLKVAVSQDNLRSFDIKCDQAVPSATGQKARRETAAWKPRRVESQLCLQGAGNFSSKSQLTLRTRKQWLRKTFSWNKTLNVQEHRHGKELRSKLLSERKSELWMEFHPENIVCIFLLLLKNKWKPCFFLKTSLLHDQWKQNTPVPTAQRAR